MAFSISCNHVWHSLPLKWPCTCTVAPRSTLSLRSLFRQLANFTHTPWWWSWSSHNTGSLLCVSIQFVCVCVFAHLRVEIHITAPYRPSRCRLHVYGLHCGCVKCDAVQRGGIAWQRDGCDATFYTYQLPSSLAWHLNVTCTHPWGLYTWAHSLLLFSIFVYVCVCERNCISLYPQVWTWEHYSVMCASLNVWKHAFLFSHCALCMHALFNVHIYTNPACTCVRGELHCSWTSSLSNARLSVCQCVHVFLWSCRQLLLWNRLFL